MLDEVYLNITRMSIGRDNHHVVLRLFLSNMLGHQIPFYIIQKHLQEYGIGSIKTIARSTLKQSSHIQTKTVVSIALIRLEITLKNQLQSENKEKFDSPSGKKAN